ncbi:uncharacterized protein LOC135221185 [Macrobrachium nipponense]|uniref:uncharacterized protein LOC135221185 n=1 Tax=Macrobrachium nipponense TaxID=159736 RepID=UPI0030C833E2
MGIPSEYKKTADDKDFLLYDSGSSEQRILFSTSTNISLLENSDDWFGDVGSNAAMVAILEQDTDDGCHPWVFFSKKLTATEQKYSTFDMALLAVYRAIRHLCHMLGG